MAIPRLVLDTNVCLDLIVFADPRVAALRDALRAGEAVAVTRADCREEWLRVLRYPRLGLDDAGQRRHADTFDTFVTCLDDVTPVDVRLPRCKDRDDQKFLELALQARAAALLTRDDDLLALARRTRRDGLFDILVPEAWAAGAAPAA